MKVIILFLAYLWYAYIAIKMLIDIEDFGDFIWFIFVGGIILFLIRVALTGLLMLLFGDD